MVGTKLDKMAVIWWHSWSSRTIFWSWKYNTTSKQNRGNSILDNLFYPIHFKLPLKNYVHIILIFQAKLRKSTPSSNIVYVSPCPNCVRGVCKIRKHHQMILRGSHNLQFMPLWERDSATTSGSSTPVRIGT